jgi:hypothetical protein
MSAEGEKPSEDEATSSSKSWRDKIFGRLKKPKPVVGDGRAHGRTDVAEARAKSGTQVNTGTIINLMSVDAFQVGSLSSYLHFLFPSVPVQLAMSIVLLYQVLGWSAIASFVVMVLLIPVNMGFARLFTNAYKNIMKCTDARIHTANEVLQNVKIIKVSWLPSAIASTYPV